MQKLFISLLLFCLVIPFVNAATLHGAVYDFELKPALNAIVFVNSNPEQRFVAKDGTYSFTLEKGSYVVRAVLAENKEVIASTQETVSIRQDGDFTLDLVLFPTFGDLESLLNQTSIEVPVEEDSIPVWSLVILGLLFLAVLVFFLFRKNKKIESKEKLVEKESVKETLDDDLGKDILKIVKEEGGRILQKEIRKRSKFSEAKISLVISQLESEGRIKKIKKGRGNIIVLQ